MEIVRYGIIGVGNMGMTHLKNIISGQVENAVVTAIADPKQARRQAVCEAYPDVRFAFYEKGEDLIEKAEVDAVIIATPHYDHSRLAILAMEKGSGRYLPPSSLRRARWWSSAP